MAASVGVCVTGVPTRTFPVWRNINSAKSVMAAYQRAPLALGVKKKMSETSINQRNNKAAAAA